MNALESRTAAPALLSARCGLGKVTECKGEACIASGHAVLNSQQEMGNLVSSTFNLWVHRKKKFKKRKEKVVKDSTELS